jgi:3'(2'), 5'-bisphosphate nucleotidase
VSAGSGAPAYQRELQIAVRAALAAGEVIREHYARGSIAVETKSDNSPVTAADRDANAVIVRTLGDAFPADYLLSEELPDATERLSRSRVWIIDPLDGTRDFVQRTDHFAVHVGLAVDGKAVVGAVYVPVHDVMYSASIGGGAWCTQDIAKEARGGSRLHVSARTGTTTSTGATEQLRFGVSRTNPHPALAPFFARLTPAPSVVGKGASLKFMAIAEGSLDAAIYPGTSEHEWDTCAPEVILREAGGRMTDLDGAELVYNQPHLDHPRGSLATNGVCHDRLLELVRENHLISEKR